MFVIVVKMLETEEKIFVTEGKMLEMQDIMVAYLTDLRISVIAEKMFVIAVRMSGIEEKIFVTAGIRVFIAGFNPYP